jgi:uncharacterized protein (UPF0264 family)
MELLVSVRSAAEAQAALAGGAAVIDVKEPRHGPLGAAPEAAIREVVHHVAGRRPVSAALGELADGSDIPSVPGLSYVKWGLARCERTPGWQNQLAAAGGGLRRTNPCCRPVATAYGDWRRAGAPPPQLVWEFVRNQGWDVFLLDTCGKDGTTLLDWLPGEELIRLCRQCRAAGVRVALAGSLGPEQIAQLKPAAPDWFAVRGAACRGGRDGTIDGPAVRRLVQLVRSP